MNRNHLVILALGLLLCAAAEPALAQVSGIGGGGAGPMWGLVRLLVNVIFMPLIGLAIGWAAFKIAGGHHGFEVLGLVGVAGVLIAFWEQIVNVFMSGAAGIGAGLGFG